MRALSSREQGDSIRIGIHDFAELFLCVDPFELSKLNWVCSSQPRLQEHRQFWQDVMLRCNTAATGGDPVGSAEEPTRALDLARHRRNRPRSQISF